MKVLLTGANGFIGSYLAAFLLKKGHSVVATARDFHPATREWLAGAELMQLDVLDKADLDQFQVSADVLIHTATANDIISKDTAKGIELSAVGTRNILDLAIRNKIPRCMVFSTLQVYGTELMGTVDENTPANVQNDYGLNHLFAEMYAEMYSRQGKLQCVSVRPSNVYGRIRTGSFNRWSLVPGCFCKEALDSGTITIKSSGKQMRNFVNLENLSRAVDSILQHFPGSYECYNLASSRGYTMVEIAEKVKAVYEKIYPGKVELNITGTEPAMTNHFSINLAKLEKTGFTEDEHFTLESEITELFNYLQTK
ncbi:MAG TPA: NAD(P)-dependent oxidoreductase [Chitinophagaceae bacterium]|jgi:UDP-glucose 4-epimerase|nr:NAD(P)-dependent oxidoreductase [Chitinophagaceae bacterium]